MTWIIHNLNFRSEIYVERMVNKMKKYIKGVVDHPEKIMAMKELAHNRLSELRSVVRPYEEARLHTFTTYIHIHTFIYIHIHTFTYITYIHSHTYIHTYMRHRYIQRERESERERERDIIIRCLIPLFKGYMVRVKQEFVRPGDRRNRLLFAHQIHRSTHDELMVGWSQPHGS